MHHRNTDISKVAAQQFGAGTTNASTAYQIVNTIPRTWILDLWKEQKLQVSEKECTITNLVIYRVTQSPHDKWMLGCVQNNHMKPRLTYGGVYIASSLCHNYCMFDIHGSFKIFLGSLYFWEIQNSTIFNVHFLQNGPLLHVYTSASDCQGVGNIIGRHAVKAFTAPPSCSECCQ